MQTCFEVVRDGDRWDVCLNAKVLCSFHTQMEAFMVAVAAARRMREVGRTAHVRVVRNFDFREAAAAM